MIIRKWKKWGTVLMCIALLFTSVVSRGTYAFAANMEADIVSVDENLYEEDSTDVTENNEENEGDTKDKNTEMEDNNQKAEEGDADENQEKDDVKESDVENLEKEQENTESTDAQGDDQKDEENEIEDEDSGENANENQEKDNEEEDEILTEGVDENLMLMAASGASGTFGDTNWMISTNGKLTVEGTGEAGNTNLVAGSIYRTLPWYEYRDSII